VTKIAFVTDQHFDFHSRFEETIRVHNWIAEDAEARGCELTLLGGDLFERKSCPEERNAVADWLLRLAQFGPVLGVYGNHEHHSDLEIFNLLEAPHPVRFHDRPRVEMVNGVAVACLPWPRKAHLLAAFGEAGSEEIGNLAQHHLRSILRGLGDQLERQPGCPHVALAHVMIDGAKTDHDQPVVGADMAISLQDMALLRADFYACGHVHAQQEEYIGEAPCIYGGAPRHNNFGEPGPKGYVVLEFDGPRLVAWERIATPCTRMVLLFGLWEDGHIELYDIPSVAGAEVRLRFEVPSDQREAARVSALVCRDRLLAEGALSVKIEEQVTTVGRARQPEIAAALTLDDKLSALWRAQTNAPANDRRPQLLAKVHELEEETHAA
jgi:DNA repair exonuclease SbcCD nuclease subunit